MACNSADYTDFRPIFKGNFGLIETVKANRLEPYAYLRHLFTELPRAETVEAIEALLPGNLTKDQIRIG